MIPESTIDKIKSVALIKDFCSTEKGYGQNKLFCKCPACGSYDAKKKQGLTIDTKKNVAHCFHPSCGVNYSNAIDFIMKTENLTYPDALRYIAKDCNIFIEETAEPAKPKNGKKVATPKPPKATPVDVRPQHVVAPETPQEKNDRDSLFNDAAELVILTQQGSASLIQRKFSIGYLVSQRKHLFLSIFRFFHFLDRYFHTVFTCQN